MEWVKLVAIPAYYIDGALLRAGEAAEVLFCRALAYCGGVESAGVIDKTVLPMIVPTRTQQRADALVREGLWVDEGAQYRIRTWDKWQDEHDVAAEKRRKDRERQREHRRKARQGEPRDSHTDPSRDSHSDKRDCHDVDVEVDVEREGEPPATQEVAASRPKRATRVPETFPPDAEAATRLKEWAADTCPLVELKSETENWQDWHRAKGDTAKDWIASWRTWMRRAQKDAEQSSRRQGPSTTDQRVATGLALVEHFRQQELA